MKHQIKTPMVRPMVPKTVLDAMDKAYDAKSAAAVQPDAMYDYIEICDIKFHRPTIAHTWIYMLIAKQSPTLLTDPVVIGYLLSHEQEGARNKVLREVLNETIREASYKFVMEKNIDPVEFFETVQILSDDLFKKKQTAENAKHPEDSHPSGGAV